MLTIEIVAIGNEILKGITLNTNATEISKALFDAGYAPCRHTALPDDPMSLKSGLQECLKRSRIVIATGGLGPTCDDTTRQAAAALFGSSFHLDEQVAKSLAQRYGAAIISLENQATVPSKATVLENTVGTAPGLAFHTETSTLILMPGVPREMRAMLHSQTIPFLQKHFPHKQHHISQKLHFFDLSESAVDPILRRLQSDFPEIEFGIYPSHGILTVVATIKAAAKDAPAPRLDAAAQLLLQHFAAKNFKAPSGKLEEAVQELFIRRGWTLSLAESCTGGSVAAKLVQLPGASAYFLGGIVAYSYAFKTGLLEVPNELLLEKGAVSEETVVAMVSGLLARTGSDFGIAISGIAGPDGGTKDKPVGTVWIAVAGKGQIPQTHRLLAYGNRDMIIERSVNAALSELLLYCKSSEN